MKNVWKIIKDDFKKLFSSSITIVVVFGLIIVPTIYSLFNIAGYWDPYSGTENLEIGVVNSDDGYKSDVLPFDIQFGDTVVSALNDNKDFKWVYTDYDKAMEELESGKFYAVIVVPKDFSQQLINILNGKTQGANLEYYSNQKRSPITPKLIDTGVTSIQLKINQSFSSTVYEAVLKLAIKLTNATDSGTMTRLSATLSDTFGRVKGELDSAILQMDSLKGMLDNMDGAIDTTNNLMPSGDNSKIDELYRILGEAKSTASNSRSFINKAADTLKQFGVYDRLKPLIDDMLNTCASIEGFSGTGQNIIDDTKKLKNETGQSLTSLKDLTSELRKQIDNMQKDFTEISKDLQSAKDSMQALSNSSSVDDVKKILGNDAGSFAHLLSSPVKMETHELYPVENFGTAISGFFISLSCWAGCLILTTILITSLTRKRLKKLQKTGKYKPWQSFIGRYAIYGTIALCQTTLMCLGCIFFLQMQIAHPFLFMVTGWIVALVFSFFIYSLVAAFGSLGKVLAVILLVLQVGASGGTFPIAMVTDIYQQIYPFLPVTYTIKAFNMCIAGYSDIMVYWQYIGIVFGSLTVISLLIGLILRVPNEKLAEWFMKKLHATKLFAI